MVTKKNFTIFIVTLFYGIALCAIDETEISIKAESSAQPKSRQTMDEKSYRDRLRALRQELDTLQASILLAEPEVHTKRLATIEQKFDELNRELEKDGTKMQMSRMFYQQRANVERTIGEIKELLHKPETFEMLKQNMKNKE